MIVKYGRWTEYVSLYYGKKPLEVNLWCPSSLTSIDDFDTNPGLFALWPTCMPVFRKEKVLKSSYGQCLVFPRARHTKLGGFCDLSFHNEYTRLKEELE